MSALKEMKCYQMSLYTQCWRQELACISTRATIDNTFSFKCSGCCVANLGSAIEAFDSVKKIREKIWVSPDLKKPLGSGKP